MTDITYILRSDILTDEDDNDHIVYGITAKNTNNEVLDSIPDIFFDKNRAKDFVSFCNDKNVALKDLAELAEKQLY